MTGGGVTGSEPNWARAALTNPAVTLMIASEPNASTMRGKRIKDVHAGIAQFVEVIGGGDAFS